MQFFFRAGLGCRRKYTDTNQASSASTATETQDTRVSHDQGYCLGLCLVDHGVVGCCRFTSPLLETQTSHCSFGIFMGDWYVYDLSRHAIRAQRIQRADGEVVEVKTDIFSVFLCYQLNLFGTTNTWEDIPENESSVLLHLRDEEGPPRTVHLGDVTEEPYLLEFASLFSSSLDDVNQEESR